MLDNLRDYLVRRSRTRPLNPWLGWRHILLGVLFVLLPWIVDSSSRMANLVFWLMAFVYFCIGIVLIRIKRKILRGEYNT